MADADPPRVRRARASEAADAVSVVAAFFGEGGCDLLVDLDGTLVHSETVNQTALRQYFRQRGWDVADDVIRTFSGRRARDVFAAVQGPWGDEDPLVLTREVQHVVSRLGVRPEPVAGAAQLVEACVRTGLPVGVVTSATREWAVLALRSLNVDVAAIRMVTDEDCTSGKPDAEPFRRGADLLGLDPSNLVAIEDAPAGIASALAAGMGLVVGVATGRSADCLHSAGAHVTAPDLRGFAAAVTNGRSTRGSRGDELGDRR